MFERVGSLVVAVILGTSLSGCGKTEPAPESKTSFVGADITDTKYGQGLSLPDLDGQMRSMKDFKGKVTVVFFGYTQCPDVCPTTMTEMAQVKQGLGPDASKLQVVFITIDPERDTPEILKSYVSNFDPSFIALRGTPEQTRAAAGELKVYYAKVPGKSEGSYTMDHTAGAYVFDTEGRVRVFERYGAGAEGLTADVKELLKNG